MEELEIPPPGINVKTTRILVSISWSVFFNEGHLPGCAEINIIIASLENF